MKMSELPKKTEELELSEELQEPKGEAIADLVRAMLDADRRGSQPGRPAAHAGTF